MSAVSNVNDATAVIIQTIHEENPQSIQELVDIVSNKLSMSKKDTFALILKLKATGSIHLTERSSRSVSSNQSYWYYLTILISTIAVILAFAVPTQAVNVIYTRNIFALLFIFFVPGYVIAKIFYPQKVTNQLPNGLAVIEMVGLSVALSIAIVPLMGLLLYYSPFNLSLSSVVVSLFLFTLVFSTIAFAKEKQTS